MLQFQGGDEAICASESLCSCSRYLSTADTTAEGLLLGMGSEHIVQEDAVEGFSKVHRLHSQVDDMTGAWLHSNISLFPSSSSSFMYC